MAARAWSCAHRLDVSVSALIKAAECDCHSMRPHGISELLLSCCVLLPPCRRREEVSQVYETPLLDLVFHAASVHRMYNDPSMVRSLSAHTQPCWLLCWSGAQPPCPSDYSLTHTHTQSFISQTHMHTHTHTYTRACLHRCSAAHCCLSRRVDVLRTAAIAARAATGQRTQGSRQRS